MKRVAKIGKLKTGKLKTGKLKGGKLKNGRRDFVQRKTEGV
jgi:hypothetical protein